jgi:putative addiction module component (TIGR02574 family)
MEALPKEIAALSVSEKLQLVHDLWDSIDAKLMPPITEAQKVELDRRVTSLSAHPGPGASLEDIAASVGVRL